MRSTRAIVFAIGLFSVPAAAQATEQLNSAPLSTLPPYAGWIAIAKGPVPGFAGVVISFNLGPDRSIFNCVLNIMVTDTMMHADAARKYFSLPDANQGTSRSECGHVQNLKIRQAKYDVVQLVDWFEAIEKVNRSRQTNAAPGRAAEFMAKRVDVRQNQIQIASPNPELITRLRKIADSLAVPSDAIEFSDEDVRGVLAGLGLVPPSPSSAATIYFEFQVDTPAQILNNGKERLARLAKNSGGVVGDASVQFVVNTDGKADPATFKVLRTTSDQISLFLRQQIGSMAFSPALRTSLPVPQLVQMTFHFD